MKIAWPMIHGESASLEAVVADARRELFKKYPAPCLGTCYRPSAQRLGSRPRRCFCPALGSASCCFGGRPRTASRVAREEALPSANARQFTPSALASARTVDQTGSRTPCSSLATLNLYN